MEPQSDIVAERSVFLRVANERLCGNIDFFINFLRTDSSPEESCNLKPVDASKIGLIGSERIVYIAG